MEDTTFQPEIRPAARPIERKRRVQTRPAPKPQFADAVWKSFETGTEQDMLHVPADKYDDIVRSLKRAARYLDRTRDVEVRVQVGKPEPETNHPDYPELDHPGHVVVKFLGHRPRLLGRRIAKEATGDTDAPSPRRRRVVG